MCANLSRPLQICFSAKATECNDRQCANTLHVCNTRDTHDNDVYYIVARHHSIHCIYTSQFVVLIVSVKLAALNVDSNEQHSGRWTWSQNRYCVVANLVCNNTKFGDVCNREWWNMLKCLYIYALHLYAKNCFKDKRFKYHIQILS